MLGMPRGGRQLNRLNIFRTVFGAKLITAMHPVTRDISAPFGVLIAN